MKKIKQSAALLLLAAMLTFTGVAPGFASDADSIEAQDVMLETETETETEALNDDEPLASVSETSVSETSVSEISVSETPASETPESETFETEVPQETDISLEGVKDVPDFQFNFETVCENEKASLLIDKSVNNLRVVSKATGAHYDTKVMNGQSGNDMIKNNQKSDFVMNYVKDKAKATTVTMDAYTQSIVFEQVEYTPLNDGIRCEFTVGNTDQLHITLFPMYIDMERLETFVLQYMTDRQQREFLKDFYTPTKTRAVRNWNTLKKDGTPTSVPISRLRRLYEAFYEVGTYTAEELAFDNEQWGEETIDSSITFKVTMEYRLEGSDLVVSLTSIETEEQYPISDITLNPYLLNGDIFDEGYLFVPEGSGAIIDFNSGNTLRPAVNIPIYGKDPLIAPYLYTEDFAQATLPVMGVKKNNIAILGIIEEGAGNATLMANIAGKMDEFNKISVRFDITYMERIYSTYGRGQMMPMYLNESYSGNITMRYRLLEGEDANYTGMAKSYKEYLKEHGLLKDNPVPDDAPLFVDMVATALQKKMVLGFSVTEYLPTATTSDAISILDSLRANGVKNTVLEYRDFMNNGVENATLTKIKVINSIGGQKGLAELLQYTASHNVDFFPSIRMNTVFSKKGLPKGNDALTRYIDNNVASRVKLDLMSRTTFNAGSFSVLMSPTYIRDSYVSAVIKNMHKLNFSGLALNDSGTLLYGDYGRKNQLMRSEGAAMFTDTFGRLAEAFDLLYANPNAYAFATAGYISDIPVKGSSRRAVDYQIPFVQMVLENDVPYSLPAYNEDAMAWNGFDEYLLKAIETKSSLKFILTKADESLFANSLINANNNTKTYFMTRYDRWENKIGGYYGEYDAFYQQVKDAQIKSHEYISPTFVKVVYTNGVTVYVNYGSKPAEADGVTVDGVSYVVRR